MKKVNDDYIAKAKKLNEEDRDRVLSRMAGKLPKRLQKEKLTVEEAIAIQLELEDEQLQEWRANLTVIQEKAAKAKTKAEGKAAKANEKEVPAKVAKPAVVKTAPAKKMSPVANSAVTTKTPAKPVATAKPAVKK